MSTSMSMDAPRATISRSDSTGVLISTSQRNDDGLDTDPEDDHDQSRPQGPQAGEASPFVAAEEHDHDRDGGRDAHRRAEVPEEQEGQHRWKGRSEDQQEDAQPADQVAPRH